MVSLKGKPVLAETNGISLILLLGDVAAGIFNFGLGDLKRRTLVERKRMESYGRPRWKKSIY